MRVQFLSLHMFSHLRHSYSCSILRKNSVAYIIPPFSRGTAEALSRLFHDLRAIYGKGADADVTFIRSQEETLAFSRGAGDVIEMYFLERLRRLMKNERRRASRIRIYIFILISTHARARGALFFSGRIETPIRSNEPDGKFVYVHYTRTNISM